MLFTTETTSGPMIKVERSVSMLHTWLRWIAVPANSAHTAQSILIFDSLTLTATYSDVRRPRTVFWWTLFGLKHASVSAPPLRGSVSFDRSPNGINTAWPREVKLPFRSPPGGGKRTLPNYLAIVGCRRRSARVHSMSASIQSLQHVVRGIRTGLCRIYDRRDVTRWPSCVAGVAVGPHATIRIAYLQLVRADVWMCVRRARCSIARASASQSESVRSSSGNRLIVARDKLIE